MYPFSRLIGIYISDWNTDHQHEFGLGIASSINAIYGRTFVFYNILDNGDLDYLCSYDMIDVFEAGEDREAEVFETV